MECKKADELIMKYMDNAISKKEAYILNEHLNICEKCMADFKVYDEIMTNFSEIAIASTDECFEQAVMAKIEECGTVYSMRRNMLDNIFTVIIGFVSVLFGIGFLLAVNRDQIMESMINNHVFGAYASFMNPMVNLITQYSASFINVVTNSAISAAQYMVDFRFAVLTCLLALLAVQLLYTLRKKDKVGE